MRHAISPKSRQQKAQHYKQHMSQNQLQNRCSDGDVHLLVEICSVELIFASGGLSLTIRLSRACETYVSKDSTSGEMMTGA